jgi:hypothetical protein
MSGGIPNLLENWNAREPTVAAEPEKTSEIPPQSSVPLNIDRRPVGGCSMRVSTEPSGVEVFIGNQKKGLTPTVVSGVCQESINLTLKKQGFESVSENIKLAPKVNELYKVLKKTPVGTLQIVVDQNAEIYIDGYQVGTVQANTPFEKTLRANRPYRVRLYNPALKMESTTEITIPEGSVYKQKIRLEELKKKKR